MVHNGFNYKILRNLLHKKLKYIFVVIFKNYWRSGLVCSATGMLQLSVFCCYVLCLVCFTGYLCCIRRYNKYFDW